MVKKTFLSLLMLSLVVVSAAVPVVFSESQQTEASVDTVDSTDGLSLEKATEILLQDNAKMKLIHLALDKAEITADDLESDARDAKNHFTYGTPEYAGAVDLPRLQAEFTLEIAQRNVEATKESLKAQLEESYYGLLHAKEAAEIKRDALHVAEEIYEQTEKKLELGLVAKQEVLKAELNVIEARNEYEAAVNQLKKAEMNFNVVLGREVTDEVNLAGSLEPLNFETVEIEEVVSEAKDKRNEIVAAQYQFDIAQLSFDYVSETQSEITYDYREAQVSLEEAEENLENTKRQIEMEVRSNYLDIQEKQKKIEQMEKSVALAEESLKIAQVSYENGLNVFTDVQEAQQALSQAKLGLSQAILEYNLAVGAFEDSISQGRTVIQTQ